MSGEHKLYLSLRFCFPINFCVGGDAHIAPFDINKFAKNFLKNGAIRWADVGIGPYERESGCP